MGTSVHEQAAVLALVKAAPGAWHHTASLLTEVGSAERVLSGDLPPISDEHRAYAYLLRGRTQPSDVDAAHELIERVTERGARLSTVVDDDYPVNLRMIYNRPPFIWTRGELHPADRRAVAVVGTRQATARGRAYATELARGLAEAGITVVSGLARGIDTCAHTATLEAHGHTVAVLGTGILARTYPADNAALAERIAEHGAVVSQFWPDAPPRRTNFPLRNVVTSGLAAGTVVVEASATSGAKMQARFALEHGKRLYLSEELLAEQEWARRYAERKCARVVQSLDDILRDVVRLVEIPHQLPLAL